MPAFQHIGAVVSGLLLAAIVSSCSSLLYPTHDHFLKDGEPVPTIDLSYYKSVQLRPGQDSTLAVALAISGGGSRAANFGIGIMLGLEQLALGEGENMLQEVDYISTVSGGGFAGGAYVTALYEHRFFNREEPFSLKAYLDRQIKEALAFSYAGVLLRANFNPRLLFSYVDEGDALERAIDEHVMGYKRRRKLSDEKCESLLLGQFFVPHNSTRPVLYPMFITNSSILRTMAIFPFTPDILDRYQITGYTHRLQRVVEDSLSPFRVPVSVGVKASGSFPVLISNSTLRSRYNATRPFLHLIDGAMAENIGYYTALQALRQEQARRKLLLIIDADASGHLYTFSSKEGAAFSLKVLAKLPGSGLSARHTTLVQDIRNTCIPFGITPLFFSFNVLLKDITSPPPEVLDPSLEQQRLIYLLQRGESLSETDRHVLYELLTHIDTKYTITPEEQELLLLSGQLIVRLQEPQIRELLRGTEK
jgi:hypothetical protein